MHKKTELIKVLLPIHALQLAHCTDKEGSTLLHHAAINGNEEIATILLENNADAEKQNHVSNTPLSIIAGKSEKNRNTGHLRIAKMLLNKMSAQSVNAKTEDNLTALEWSFNNNHKEAAVLLLGYKHINVSTFVLYGHNILTRACMKEWDDVIELILSLEEGKKLIHQSNTDNYTPLHHAAIRGNVKIAQLLLDNGANANATTDSKNTPLSIIAGREKNQQMPEHVAIAEMLLSKMSPEYVNARTQVGMTALGWAVRNLNHEIVLLLIQYNGINLTELFNGKTINQVAMVNKWFDVVNALTSKRVERWLVRNDMDTLDNQVRDLSLTVLEQKEEIEKLNKIIKDLKAKLPADSASSSVGTLYRPSVDKSVHNGATNTQDKAHISI
jgi:ankyrin repeat protein